MFDRKLTDNILINAYNKNLINGIADGSGKYLEKSL